MYSNNIYTYTLKARKLELLFHVCYGNGFSVFGLHPKNATIFIGTVLL